MPRLLVWNLKWARPGSRRGELILRRIEELDPDVAVLTEVAGHFISGGYTVEPRRGWGYEGPAWRKKVQLWSRAPWHDVDVEGSTHMPGGRFTAATTRPAGLALRVIGVCIPWRAAHVSTGRKDRRPWEDHLSYLAELGSILRSAARSETVVAGDWNQRVPRARQPSNVFRALEDALPQDFSVGTAGPIPGLDRAVIDHVAVGPALRIQSVVGVPRGDAGVGDLTDHDGIIASLAAA
jgi:endonuclease/exonuclease/phosphatase family metal-dependent hydrolase